MPETIAFVGVGRMGANLARRLKDCGLQIGSVYDANLEVASQLASELQVLRAEDLKSVTRSAGTIFTVISNDQAMKAIFRGGLLSRAKGKLFINCATLSPAAHEWTEQRAAKAGAQVLAACMASSIPQARNGKLYLMCGGKPEAFERAKPILELLSASMMLVGSVAAAAQVKALVNMVMNINTAGLAEGLGLGAALGIDLPMLRQVFAQTGARSGVLETDGEDMQNREHSCFFSAEHAAKDSGIAVKLAQEAGLKLPLALATKRQYDLMVRKGLGALDKSGIAELTFKDRVPSPA